MLKFGACEYERGFTEPNALPIWQTNLKDRAIDTHYTGSFSAAEHIYGQLQRMVVPSYVFAVGCTNTKTMVSVCKVKVRDCVNILRPNSKACNSPSQSRILMFCFLMFRTLILFLDLHHSTLFGANMELKPCQ